MREIKKWEVMFAAENRAKINYKSNECSSFIDVTNCVIWEWNRGTYIIGNKTKDGYYLHEVLNKVESFKDIYKTGTLFSSWDNFASYYIHHPKEIENIILYNPSKPLIHYDVCSIQSTSNFCDQDYIDKLIATGLDTNKRCDNTYKFKHYSMWNKIVIELKENWENLLRGEKISIEGLKERAITENNVYNNCYLCDEHYRSANLNKCDKCELNILSNSTEPCAVYNKLSILLRTKNKVIRTSEEAAYIIALAEQIRDCVL